MTPGPVDHATLAAVAAAAIGAGGQVRVVDWLSRQIFAGDGRGLGVYRFDGTASHEGETVRWSAILKVLGRAGNDDEDERGWDYWRREALAFRSGLLAQLPGGLSAPRLLHATEGVGGRGAVVGGGGGGDRAAVAAFPVWPSGSASGPVQRGVLG